MENPIETTTGVSLPTTMRTINQTGFGRPDRVIEMVDVAIPQVTAGKALVRVAAASVNALDWHYLTGTPYLARVQMGFRTPKRRVPGADISGTVVAVGEDVTNVVPGAEVYGEVGGGGFAEYALVRAAALTPRPSNLSLVESATLGVAGLTAIQGLRDWGGMKEGDRVLINGGSGGVGTFAIQVAKALGASHVTAVVSTRNVEAASRIGADRVIDYTKEDFTSGGGDYDVLFDNAGSATLGKSRRMLAPDGRMAMITGKKGRWVRPVDRMLGGLIRSKLWTQTFRSGTAQPNSDDLKLLTNLVETGLVTPVIDRRFGLDQAVAALAYQGEGHARGKSLVIP